MILVTGATGHVARTVVCRLASLGHDVAAMVRDVQAASRRLPSGITLRCGLGRESITRLAASLGLRVERVDHPWKIVPISLIMFQLRRMLHLSARAQSPAARAAHR